MPDFQNDDGGKLAHPGLTSKEIFDLVQLAAAAYKMKLSAADWELSRSWTPITANLGLKGYIKSDYYYESETYTATIDIPRAIYPGTAQAVVFSDGAGDLVLSFRGTAEFGFPFIAGDSGDWGPIGQKSHYRAFRELFTALDEYIKNNVSVDRLLVTGHSLGAAMVELYMDEYTDGGIRDIQYEAIAVASPRASNNEDDYRVLNIGHDGDIVYSAMPTKLLGDNAVDNIYMLFNDGGFLDLGISERWGAQHNIDYGYTHTVRTILSSQFYGETTRDSDIVINYSDQPDDIRDLVDDFWTPDDSQLILGRGADPTKTTVFDIKAGVGTLSIDDHLIGGDGDDWLEGFSGNDTLEGDVNDGPLAGGNDTMAGGRGQDLFLGAPEDLDGDTIVDLEFGDRIGTSDATVDPETIGSTRATIFFNADSGLLDIGGTDVTINAILPDGATLRLLDESLEDGGSILEVVGGGQDIAFVVDTTGSMHDDIASVKASATDIINAVFDPERGLNDSRIAVVGFNDPSTETVLSFTNQTDPDDRKEAALNAITRLDASGGGDFPELTYTGLLRALDGRAGEWREDAVARKIILFGDATAKDTHLRDQVIALANDLGVGVEDRTDVDASARAAAFSSIDLAEDISLTTFSVAAEPEDGPSVPVSVQIFTVAIGSNPDTISEFESIAEETGGDDFRAADASEIVEKLLEIINLPIDAISLATLINTTDQNLSQFKGLTAAYSLLGGVPSIDGYSFLINRNNETNFGAGGTTVFNDENIYINTVNALYQGNADARAKFDAIMRTGDTLAEKLSLVYDHVIPEDARSDAGRVYFLSQAEFYAARAAELGIEGPNGASVVAFASLMKIAVDADIDGFGGSINDLVYAVENGTAAIPESSDTFTPIETALGGNPDGLVSLTSGIDTAFGGAGDGIDFASLNLLRVDDGNTHGALMDPIPLITEEHANGSDVSNYSNYVYSSMPEVPELGATGETDTAILSDDDGPDFVQGIGPGVEDMAWTDFI